MITTKEQYQRAIGHFIREEEDGIEQYKSLINDLPCTSEFSSIRQALRRIASDEKEHVTILRRLMSHI